MSSFNSVVEYLLHEWQTNEDPYLMYTDKFDKFMEERLFSEIEPGDIVVQTWAWVGIYDRIIPYWQVRLIKNAEIYHGIMSEREARRRFERRFRREGQGVYTPNPEGGLDYYCHAVPYTAWPMEIQWFHIAENEPKPDIEKIGLINPVPSWEEHGKWYENCRQDIELPAHWSTNRRQIVSDIVVSLRRPKNDGRPVCPLATEKEIVELLDVLPVKYWEWTRKNFEEKRRILFAWLGKAGTVGGEKEK